MCESIMCDVNGKLVVNSMESLQCDHEEADTRMFIYAQQAAMMEWRGVLIQSSDTDVFILAPKASIRLDCHLSFVRGKLSELHVENICNIVTCLGYDAQTLGALIGLHVLSGCHTVRFFLRKSRIKPLELMLERPEFIRVFDLLGREWTVSEECMTGLQKFVCCLNGQSGETRVNDAGFQAFKEKMRNNTVITPNEDCLILHVKRANYQTGLYRRCMEGMIVAPCPLEHG